MREVRASQAKAQLAELLDEVEAGSTIVITRHGRAIARLVPETAGRQAEIRAAIDQIKAFGRRRPKLSAAEIRDMIDEGRKH